MTSFLFKVTKPEEPSEEDCCHSDCTNCVFDVYRKKLELWHKQQNSQSDQFIRNDVLSETRFKPFSLTEKRKLTTDTHLYSFEAGTSLATMQGCLQMSVGQHLVLRSTVYDKRKNKMYISRSYTIIPDKEINRKCGFKVLIKTYPNGVMSKYVSSLCIGDVTYWRGPYGKFNYTPNTNKNLLLICIGTGIAPIYGLAKEIVQNEADETFVQLLYGSKQPCDIILRQELNNLSSFWNFRCVHFLSQKCDFYEKKYNETFIPGRITYERIKPFLKEKCTYVVLCGTDSFCAEMKKPLNDFGVTDENMYIFQS